LWGEKLREARSTSAGVVEKGKIPQGRNEKKRSRRGALRRVGKRGKKLFVRTLIGPGRKIEKGGGSHSREKNLFEEVNLSPPKEKSDMHPGPQDQSLGDFVPEEGRAA